MAMARNRWALSAGVFPGTAADNGMGFYRPSPMGLSRSRHGGGGGGVGGGGSCRGIVDFNVGDDGDDHDHDHDHDHDRQQDYKHDRGEMRVGNANGVVVSAPSVVTPPGCVPFSVKSKSSSSSSSSPSSPSSSSPSSSSHPALTLPASLPSSKASLHDSVGVGNNSQVAYGSGELSLRAFSALLSSHRPPPGESDAPSSSSVLHAGADLSVFLSRVPICPEEKGGGGGGEKTKTNKQDAATCSSTAVATTFPCLSLRAASAALAQLRRSKPDTHPTLDQRRRAYARSMSSPVRVTRRDLAACGQGVGVAVSAGRGEERGADAPPPERHKKRVDFAAILLRNIADSFERLLGDDLRGRVRTRRVDTNFRIVEGGRKRVAASSSSLPPGNAGTCGVTTTLPLVLEVTMGVEVEHHDEILPISFRAPGAIAGTHNYIPSFYRSINGGGGEDGGGTSGSNSGNHHHHHHDDDWWGHIFRPPDRIDVAVDAAELVRSMSIQAECLASVAIAAGEVTVDDLYLGLPPPPSDEQEEDEEEKNKKDETGEETHHQQQPLQKEERERRESAAALQPPPPPPRQPPIRSVSMDGSKGAARPRGKGKELRRMSSSNASVASSSSSSSTNAGMGAARRSASVSPPAAVASPAPSAAASSANSAAAAPAQVPFPPSQVDPDMHFFFSSSLDVPSAGTSRVGGGHIDVGSGGGGGGMNGLGQHEKKKKKKKRRRESDGCFTQDDYGRDSSANALVTTAAKTEVAARPSPSPRLSPPPSKKMAAMHDSTTDGGGLRNVTIDPAAAASVAASSSAIVVPPSRVRDTAMEAAAAAVVNPQAALTPLPPPPPPPPPLCDFDLDAIPLDLDKCDDWDNDPTMNEEQSRLMEMDFGDLGPVDLGTPVPT